jgi:hypothetical protein
MPHPDLTVAYRVYPRVSKGPAVFTEDKRALALFGLRSLHRALGDLRARVVALLDGCPDLYEDLVRMALPGRELDLRRTGVPGEGLGNFATFGLQVDLLSEAASPFVMFCEDDYFFLDGAIEKCLRFASQHADVDFVTPYEHPALFRLPMHDVPSEVRVSDGQHFRTINSTCLTFCGRRESLRRAAPVFRTYSRGNHDASIWLALDKQLVRAPLQVARASLRDGVSLRVHARSLLRTARQTLLGPRYRLWCPSPSLATHLEAPDLSEGLAWGRLWQEEVATVGKLVEDAWGAVPRGA